MPELLPTQARPDGGGSQTIRLRIEGILQGILTEARGSGIESQDRAWTAIPLVKLGVNSVDFMRFMNAVEEEFGIAPSFPAVEHRPLSSLDDWVEFVCRHRKPTQRGVLAKCWGGLLRVVAKQRGE